VPIHSETRASETKPVVLVVGASGETGLEVMRTVAAAGLQPRGMTRNAKRASQQHPNYAWIEADARNSAAVEQAMRDARFVICALGAPAFDGPDAPQFVDYQGVATVVDAAAAAKVRHFVLISSGSAGPHREPRKTPRLGNVLLWKTLGENHLKASGIPYTIIGPAGLTGDPPRHAGLEAIPRADYQSTNVARADVARVALDALSNPIARGKSFALINTDSTESERWRGQLNALPLDNADLGGIENLAWLAGHWTRAHNGATSEELWLPADAGLMLGISRSVSNQGRREFEWLRIEERADGVYYVAAPNGRSATEFKLTTLGEATAVFHNPAHDFPNKLSYTRRGSVLSVTIEGTSGGKPASMSWQWTLQQPLRAPHLPPVAP
jgi:uncharacterized protein YbjT (DUF2867 family)